MTSIEHLRRLTDNEAVFRKWNESVHSIGKGLNPADLSSYQTADFLCECSDENCGDKISLDYHRYGSIHQQRDKFIIVPGHETSEVEGIVHAGLNYSIVEKKLQPSKSPKALKKTNSNNS